MAAYYLLLRLIIVLAYILIFPSDPFVGVGALKFLSPPISSLPALLGFNLVINCTTDEPNAKVKLLHQPTFTNWVERAVTPNKLILRGQVFTLLNVTVSDGGRYNCEATYKSQTIRWPTFYGMAVISRGQLPDYFELIPEKPIIILQGGTGEIVCEAEGFSVTKLQWKKVLSPSVEQPVPDSMVINAKDNVNNLVRATLRITNAQSQDTGDYKCALTAYGKAARKLTRIRVDAITPPTISPFSGETTIKEGTQKVIKCVAKASPKPSANWYRYGKKLNSTYCTSPNDKSCKNVTYEVYEEKTGSALHTTYTIQVLKIRSALYPRDQGKFVCKATNGKDPPAELDFDLKVQVFPQINVSPANQTVPEGKTAWFVCKATGFPKPAITWTFNDGSLPSLSIENHTEEEYQLFLPNVTKNMEGTYRCTAENNAGRANSTSTMRILEQPTSQIIPKDYPILMPGDALILTCKVNRVTIKIKWKKNGVSDIPRAQIGPSLGNESTLYIKNVVPDDSGVYSCEASNMARTVSSNIKITVSAMASNDEEEAVELRVRNENVDKWEISRDRIVLKETIGHGAFGAVWRARLSQPDGKLGNQTVAVKCFTPTSGEEGRKALMREIELGKLFGESEQPNIIKFLGCVTTEGHPIMVMEYLALGDLLGLLRKSRGIHDIYHLGEGSIEELGIYDLVSFAKQIATGMVFLGSRGIIHRDLAARNVLVDKHYICKVTDFGLAYQTFKYGHGNAKKGCIPVKWTAPEILFGNFAELSPLSDVWSYGIVLYEIFTIGGIPYPDWSEAKTVVEIKQGYKMPKPPHVDKALYDIMVRCWNFNPEFRPPFENLRKRMESYIRDTTYLELINMDEYDSSKYAKVEDLGGEDVTEHQQDVTSSGKKFGERRCASVRQ